VRPSELHGIEHPVTAYFFDRAIYTFGTTLEADLEEAGSKAKKEAQAERMRRLRLNTWLNDGTEKKPEQKFRDPMAGGAVNA
jgi:hypothetical protein